MGRKKVSEYPYTIQELKEITIRQLQERGVEIEDISKIVFILQEKYYPNLTMQLCTENVEKVLEKREVLQCVLTGIAIDKACDKKLF
ncbi:MAG: phosphatidylglycerophosphatase A, partial [Finegoldia magna]|nr:phosphatidylglycerophosphatase A [Finegoldia magna]